LTKDWRQIGVLEIDCNQRVRCVVLVKSIT